MSVIANVHIAGIINLLMKHLPFSYGGFQHDLKKRTEPKTMELQLGLSEIGIVMHGLNSLTPVNSIIRFSNELGFHVS